MFDARKRQPGQDGGSRAVPIVLIVFSLLAIALLAARDARLQAGLRAENEALAEARNREANAVFDRLDLPPNRRLTVCNASKNDLTISALTAIYIDAGGRSAIFNSASHQWRTWRIPSNAGERELAAPESGWDGSAVFFAMDVESDGKRRLISGTSDDLAGGCIRLSAATESEEQ